MDATNSCRSQGITENTNVTTFDVDILLLLFLFYFKKKNKQVLKGSWQSKQ